MNNEPLSDYIIKAAKEINAKHLHIEPEDARAYLSEYTDEEKLKHIKVIACFIRKEFEAKEGKGMGLWLDNEIDTIIVLATS